MWKLVGCFQVWLCLQGISTLRKWLWLIDDSIILSRARPTLSWSDINYVVGAATTRRCQIVKKKKCCKCTPSSRSQERFRPRSASARSSSRHLFFFFFFLPASSFPCCVFSRHKRGALLHIPLQAFQLHHCTSPPELPGRYLSIRIYCVCSLQSQRGGEHVCHLWLGLFLQRRAISVVALEDSAAAAA